MPIACPPPVVSSLTKSNLNPPFTMSAFSIDPNLRPVSFFLDLKLPSLCV